MEKAESKFTGGLFMHIVTNAAVFASIALTAGLLLPFALCFREKWAAKNTIIDGRRHEFYGKPYILFMRKLFFLLFGPALIAIALTILFVILPDSDSGEISVLGFALVPTLTAVAIGVFMAWLSLRMKKWITRHTRLCTKKD